MSEMWAVTDRLRSNGKIMAFTWSISLKRVGAIKKFFAGIGEEYDDHASLMLAWRRNRYRNPDRRARRVTITVGPDHE